jgi:hypothetical protein
MDYYSILDNSPSQAGSETAPPNLDPSSLVPPNRVAASVVPAKLEPKGGAPKAREALRFPGEDGGKSLSEMAQRDLDATLQLLTERAQYITGASGAAIALRQGENMVCCASSGPSAPELGAHLQVDSGLSAESVKTRQILHCDDAENDPRVNRDSCRTFGIASVVVMPLVSGEEVYGVFELLSGRPRAFEERDFVALNRLAEMIQTAVEHAEAARRAEAELGQPEVATAITPHGAPPEFAAESHSHAVRPDPDKRAPEIEIALAAAAGAGTETAEPHVAPVPVGSPAWVDPPTLSAMGHEKQAEAETDLTGPITTIAFGNLRRCETCGFPVSEGRRLCLDCEAAAPGAMASVDSAPEFFGELSKTNPGWVRSHVYLIATALIAVATIALLAWRL